MWQPEGYITPVFAMDFRVGGAYRYCNAKGGQQIWAHGEYRVIEPPRHIVMTFLCDGAAA